MKSKGISLIELLVLAAMVSILAAISIPHWYGNRNIYFSELDRLASVLLLAQHTAMSRGSNTYLTFNETMREYSVFVRTDDGDILIHGPTAIDDSISELSSPATEIEFAGSSGLPLTSYLILFIDDDTYAISVGSSGEVSIFNYGETS